MNPGLCPHCGGTLEWKATVGPEKTAQTHFYECESCQRIYTNEGSRWTIGLAARK
jgi:uncharacterized protein with PIN domain